MKGTLFVYSRLERLDYRLIYAPPKSILPEPIRSDFINFAREIINVDNVLNGSIDELRWSVIKRENVVMVGVGCVNEQLGSTYKDFAGRHVRGFFGVVINSFNNGVINALCDVMFYQNLYKSFVLPLWSLTDQSKANSVCMEIDIEETAVNDINRVDINIDNSKFKILPQNIEFKDVIFSSLSHDSVDVVLNLNNLQHISSSELYHIHNATIIGYDKVELHQLDNVKEGNTIYNIGSSIELNEVGDGDNVVDEESDECKYDSCLEKILTKIERYGISLIELLYCLAKKFGYTLIKRIEDDGMSSQNQGQNDAKDCQILQKSEYPQSEKNSDWNIDEKKEERRRNIKELQNEYKKINEVNCEKQSFQTSSKETTDVVLGKDEDQSKIRGFGAEVEEIL